jgi:hypothetical protein
METINIQPGPGIYQLLSHLDISYENCLSELIDNSFDVFDEFNVAEGIVRIDFDEKKGSLIYQDNGQGLDKIGLEKSLQAACSEKNQLNHKGLYGVGFNIAMSKLSKKTDIYTKTQGQEKWLHCEYDPQKIKQQSNFEITINYLDLLPIEKSLFNNKNGLVLVIDLSKDAEDKFSSRQYRAINLKNKLAQIYSYALRKSVPGLSGKFASNNSKKYKIFIDKQEVSAFLPCIWAETRTVRRKQEDVSAVETFEFNFGTQKKCSDCGTTNPSSVYECNNCNSRKLEIFDGNLWGWIGIQRHLDQEMYGFDFIRNGRKILVNDKSLFKWEDDFGHSQIEYPVELPANLGRIVGEIHCDFLSPNAIKTNFTLDENWHRVVGFIRGNTALKPQSRPKGIENNSPLSRMFSRFRRNEKGLVDLQIGSSPNKHGSIQVSKDWFRRFHSGDADFQTDSKWYMSAKSAQDEKDGTNRKTPVTGIITDTPTSIGTILSPTSPGGNLTTQPTIVKTRNEIVLEWEESSYPLDQYCGVINLDHNRSYKEFKVETFMTPKTLIDNEDKEQSFVIEQIDGRHLKIFINENHTDWKDLKYENFLITKLTLYIKQMSNNIPEHIILKSICNTFLEKDNYSNIKEKQISLIALLSKKMVQSFSRNSSEYFEFLSSNEQEIVIEKITSENKNFQKLKDNGEFTSYLSYEGFTQIISQEPDTFLNGKLFKNVYLSEEKLKNANKKTLGYLLLAFKNLENVTQPLHNIENYTDFEKNIILSSIQFLEDSIVID